MHNFNTDAIVAQDATTTTQEPDEIGKDASDLVGALASGSWIAAALAGVLLVLAVLKKFGVIGKKKVEPPPDVKPQANADAAKDLLNK